VPDNGDQDVKLMMPVGIILVRMSIFIVKATQEWFVTSRNIAVEGWPWRSKLAYAGCLTCGFAWYEHASMCL